jgi:hypothetical protein
MSSKGLGELFEDDSADTCARNFPLMSMGAERRVSRAQTRERGPPSALAEIGIYFLSTRLTGRTTLSTSVLLTGEPVASFSSAHV